jgi:DNA-binding transcriptional ArsR family regulator
MEKNNALAALAGLAHETRLDIFRLLVEAGHNGLPAGRIGDRLDLPAPTLSFHLAHMKHAGLIGCRRTGRSLIYAAEFGQMTDLVGYLTENCCEGRPEACGLPACNPAAAAERAKGDQKHETPARARRRQ